MAKRQSHDSIIGYAWYRREQWELLRGIAADPDCLEGHYDDWLTFAEKSFKEHKRKGLNIRKVDIDIEELITWCQNKGIAVDGKARSIFAAEMVRKHKED